MTTRRKGPWCFRNEAKKGLGKTGEVKASCLKWIGGRATRLKGCSTYAAAQAAGSIA